MDYRNLRNSINVISLHLFQADDGCLGSILKCGDKDYYDHDDYDHGSGGGGCDGGGCGHGNGRGGGGNGGVLRDVVNQGVL